MRISVLKQDLLSPGCLLKPSTGGALSYVEKGCGFGAALSRVPLFRGNKQLLSTKVLDRGFFFPITSGKVGGSVPYKKLTMKVKSRKGQTAARRRVSMYWEALEGGSINAVRVKRKPKIKLKGVSYANSAHLRVYSGARPKVKKYRPKKKKRILRALFKRRRKIISKLRRKWQKKKKIIGFRKALRLLPRRRRKVRAYRYTRSIRRRSALRRAVRFSQLKVPLAWSKNLGRSRRAIRCLQLGGGGARLNSRLLVLGRASRPSEGVLPLNTANLRGLVKKKRKKPKRATSRILQTRYKPGLSKWWRLLRLQFCLSWGMPWLKQKRFTNYVSQLAHVTGLNFLRMCTYSLGFIVRASFLVYPRTSLGEKAFVNGRYTPNPFFQVYKGDRVLVLTPSLPSTHRWKTLTNCLKGAALGGWEVDGLTRSVSVWAEPSVKELQSFVFRKPTPFLTFRMYNWKYKH